MQPPDSDPSDEPLIRAAQAGDEGAFAALVERHQRRAYSVARNLVGSHEDASDVVQDAFLRVFRSLDRFDFRHTFSTWLHRIVTNLCIDLLRRRRTVTTQASDEDGPVPDLLDESAPAPDAELDRAETQAMVRDCIDSLAPHFRAVLVLRELEGKPCTEIAEIVGATHVTVRWRLHRGRKLFLEEWQRRQQTGGGAAQGVRGKSTEHKGRAIGRDEDSR